jgi:putative pyruvate formate lyase activating enzyme
MSLSEQHTLVLTADGQLIVPDLADGLLPMAAALGAVDAGPLPSRLGVPRLIATRALRLPVGDPESLPERELWRWHGRGVRALREAENAGWKPAPQQDGASLLDLKIEVATRLLGSPCRLCARRCGVDRRRGERGLCGLDDTLRLGPATRLWGEEAELGRPGVALPVLGCGLRCVFCYRREYLDPATAWTSRAVPDGGTHLHFLGGNPDESLPGVLRLLASEEDPRPIVWNTHSYVTPGGAALLEGVVDAYVADLKFGPGECAAAIAGVRGYWPAATAALRRFARSGARLIVRHVALPGHLECCARPAAAWARAHLPRARVRVLAQYEPFGPAWQRPGLDRRLEAAEREAVAALGDDPETKGWDDA